jgi:hypothetical protein
MRVCTHSELRGLCLSHMCYSMEQGLVNNNTECYRHTLESENLSFFTFAFESENFCFQCMPITLCYITNQSLKNEKINFFTFFLNIYSSIKM